MEDSAEATQVEVVELSGVSDVDRSGFTSIEESSKNHCMVDLQLGGETESLSFIYATNHLL